jgi:hypothetical protein
MIDDTNTELLRALNAPDKQVRLRSLQTLIDSTHREPAVPQDHDDVNNHIHTTYSFSPYSPTKAVWEAKRAGLKSAGIMDHDSICGAREFTEAGKIAGIATTIGIECRADFSHTPLAGRTINNPDQKSNAYIALHGIPHQYIDAYTAYFRPFIAARQERNERMTGRINEALSGTGISIDYTADVVPLSNNHDGGTVTERHLLFALALRLVGEFGKGPALIEFMTKSLGIEVPQKVALLLEDAANPFYEYDLLGLLKKELVRNFYINARQECPDVREVLAFAKECDTIRAYAYLGDVGDSVTGDKKTQRFEDGYLDELIVCIKQLGFEAVTYMPSRNSAAQVTRIMGLCARNGLLQISGEDINSPRQSFVCKAMRRDEFRHLADAAWALIGHEKAATIDTKNGFFSPETIAHYPDLNERIAKFKKIGLSVQ